MKVTRNPYEHLICAKKGWEAGYRQALLDVAQYLLDGGHAQVTHELLELEDRLHSEQR